MQRRAPSLPPPPSLSVSSGSAPPLTSSQTLPLSSSFPNAKYMKMPINLPFNVPKSQGDVQKVGIGVGIGLFIAIMILPTTAGLIAVTGALCTFGFLYSSYLHDEVLKLDTGTQEMRDVSEPIRVGAEGFLNVQYRAVTTYAFPLGFLILLSYLFRPPLASVPISRFGLGLIAAVCFYIGCGCSALSGYTSMYVASMTNIRVASAARRSYGEALIVCFRGGAFSAVLNISLCVTGVSMVYIFIRMFFYSLSAAHVPMLMVGYGFGASFVALFMQLGGGIYTKAADVGADLVGKIEKSIPEDDPRNPAVIADLVGDMVGDCVGSSADVFESVAAEIIGAMILGSTLSTEANLPEGETSKFILFPLLVHGMDILVSSVGIMYVGGLEGAHTDPMVQLQKGYRISVALSIVGFFLLTRWLLASEDSPGAWFNFFLCGICGMGCGYGIVLSTQYYTDYAYQPVRSISEASTTGHGTNIITGISVGMKSTFIPTCIISVSVLSAYHLGRLSGIGSGHNSGLFGTAVATMGMLSTACYILSMNNYGPIADNAGGIAEMSMQPEHVRDATDRLDAAGNVTKAITKGYSIGSAAMACFLLFGAFMDEFSTFSGVPFENVDIATPEVLVSGLVGSMIIFYFTGLSIAAVGKTAHQVVLEVRRQFQENPGIMSYKSKPDYKACVSLVTKAALEEMRFPAMVCVGTPVVVGLCFRVVGDITGRALLGAECLASYLMFGTVTGILMATFLDITGGAWDNAKKYVELGNFGGKNSEAHKASVTGDTVGDPFKDTAGPSLHVVIKLLSTTIL
eukprot:CAMPEP_0118656952 /NCGR_PEP_ID=MMETSP0785-20121206/13753_1 /TAXON_ID=91992 /ORGANISM="Bolidomonas pacifica, Strain CCMP 1866" /LENGTH=797 /DNA_ID=CAMNT_0006549825 /DNA_START=199 /DNA_END=2589 /DNA_ORIENTATION=-